MNCLQHIKRTLQERMPLEVITNVCVYAGGKILMSGISIVSAPIMMVLLPPKQYGLLSLIHSFNNITIALLSLGLPQVFMVEYFRADECERKQVFNDIMFVYGICTIPLFVGALLFPQIIQSYLFIPGELSNIVYAVSGICFFSFFNDVFLNLLQYQKRAIAVTVTQVMVSALTVCFNILLIGFFHMTIASALWVQGALTVGVFILGINFYIRNHYYPAFNSGRALLKSSYYLKVGLPFLPHTIVAWIFGLLNKWMIAHLAGLELAGILSLADAGGLLLYRFVLHPLQAAYGPALMNSYKSQQNNIHRVETSNHYVMGIVLAILIASLVGGYALISQYMYYIVPAAYAKAIDCVLGVTIGYVWLIGAYFVSNFIQFQKKRMIFVVALLIAMLFNVGLNFYLIPVYGIAGCVWSMMLSYALYFVLLLSYNRYLLNVTASNLKH